MYGWTVLIALAMLVVGSAWAVNTVEYEIITYDPPCTAVYLDGLEEVVRITRLNEYSLYNTTYNIPIRISVPEDQAQDTAQSLLERPRILSIQRIGSLSNGSDVGPWPVEVNPNAAMRKTLGHCFTNMDTFMEKWVYEDLILNDLYGTALQGASAPVDNRELVRIYVHNITSIVEYLENNGAQVWSNATGEWKGQTKRTVTAMIPVSLAVPLSEHDDVSSMREVSPVIPAARNDGIHTHMADGLEQHQYAEDWHAAEYDGSGIRVGVIGLSFDGIQSTTNPNLLSIPSTHFRCSTTTSAIHGCIDDQGSPLVQSHGTEVAEILMDMAPGAELFIGRANNGHSPLELTSWMVEQGVDVIVASITPSIFEGPGGGISPDHESWLEAIDYAVENGMIWVNSAGNYHNRIWYDEVPTLDKNNMVVFNGTDMENEVTLIRGKEYRFVLRWDGEWHNNADRPINLDLHLDCTGPANDWLAAFFGVTWSNSESGMFRQEIMDSPEPLEYITYTPPGDVTRCHLTVESVDGQIPAWVQIFSPHIDLEYVTTGHISLGTNSYSITNNAER